MFLKIFTVLECQLATSHHISGNYDQLLVLRMDLLSFDRIEILNKIQKIQVISLANDLYKFQHLLVH